MGNSIKDVAIIGGGAAGLVAAITCARKAKGLGVSARVRIYERDDRVGRSILVTGNGRCNFSNAAIDPLLYHNGEFAAAVLAALDAHGNHGNSEEDTHSRDRGHGHGRVQDDAVHNFFRRMGLVWRTEGEGRQYPVANKASVVLDVLRRVCEVEDVEVICDAEVVEVRSHGDGMNGAGLAQRSSTQDFTVHLKDGRLEKADVVIVACNGAAAVDILGDALPVVPLQPMLGPIAVDAEGRKITRELDNIRIRANVRLRRESNFIAAEEGELLFRKYGVSGICVFNLSRKANPGDELVIDVLHEAGLERQQFLKDRFVGLSRLYGKTMTFEQFLTGLFLPRISETILKSNNIVISDICSNEYISKLDNMFSNLSFKVEAIADEGICQVTRGGLSVESFSAENLEAIDIPGLFAAGEALDVDGPCGGYNLHWAWATGLLAGISAAHSLAKEQ